MGVLPFVTVLGAFLVGEVLEDYFLQKERQDYASMAKVACRVFFWTYLLNVGYQLLRDAAATIRLFP